MTMNNAEKSSMPFYHQWYDPQTDSHHDKMSEGLTKREEFAKAAMQGIMSNSSIDMKFGSSHPDTNEKIAGVAVIIADALLSALEKDK